MPFRRDMKISWRCDKSLTKLPKGSVIVKRDLLLLSILMTSLFFQAVKKIFYDANIWRAVPCLVRSLFSVQYKKLFFTEVPFFRVTSVRIWRSFLPAGKLMIVTLELLRVYNVVRILSNKKRKFNFFMFIFVF